MYTIKNPSLVRRPSFALGALLLLTGGLLPASGQLQISEFQSENLSTLDDEQLNSEDWIEIRNTGDERVDLEGWFLTDDPENLGKWEFPSLTVNANDEIVIFASEKNRHTALTIFQASDPVKKTHTNFKLDNDGEYLALVQPDEVTIEHVFDPYPVQIGDMSYGVGSNGETGYFAEPTPGAPNGEAGVIGPNIVEVTNVTGRPNLTEQSEMVITATVDETTHPVNEVTLYYRFDFKSESSTTMNDDGQGPDEAAGDGIYSAEFSLTSIFGNQVAPGGMIRWRVEAEDDQGNSLRLPLFHDEDDADEYFGTVAADPSTETSKLPILYWFVENPARADLRTGARSSVMFNGEFYDNILVDLHGQSTSNRSNFPQGSWDFDFNSGHRLKWREGERRVKDVNVLTNWADKSKVRNTMAYELYELCGVQGHFAFPIRIQKNGEFEGTWDMVEDGDDIYLDRVGLSEFGALYKMYNRLDGIGSPDPFSENGGEKKTRRYEDKEDLQELIDGISSGSTADKIAYLYDTVDLPRTINFLAGNVIINNTDYGHKNYYVARDTEGTGEWMQLPWDVDLSLGRRWIGSHTYFYDPIQTTLRSPEQVSGNRMSELIVNNSTFKQLYYRRIRTLYDEFYGPPGGAPKSDYMLRRLSELEDLIDPEGVVSDADLEYAKYLPQMEARDRVSNGWDNIDTMREAVDRIRNEYLPGRIDYIYGLRDLPDAQSPSSELKLEFKDIVYRPESGNPLEEFLTVQNLSGELVDLSDWQITGAVEYTFRPGTVLLTGSIFSPDAGKVYIARDLAAFRARKTSPMAGENLYAQGNYDGQLSARGETLQLLDPEGNLVTEFTYEGDPSSPQNALRITEILYNPNPAAEGSQYKGKDFEFLELHNTGTEPIDLTGVAFTDGVSLAFEEGTMLAPGAYGVVVSNRAAFETRFGNAVNILGEFSGNLSNGGERIVLQDAFNENILAFSYDQEWSEDADTQGHSLVIADPNAEVAAWDAAENWSASEGADGTPGTASSGGGPVDPSDVTYASWKSTVFSVEDQANDAVSGPAATPNALGLPNLVAYGFNLNPNSDLATGIPNVGTNDGYLMVTYRRHTKATDINFEVQVSADMSTWTAVSTEVGDRVAIDDATEWVTVRTDERLEQSSAAYMRIEVNTK